MITVAKLEMDRQTWTVYRSGHGHGYPLRLSIGTYGKGSIDVEAPPHLLAAIGHTLLKAADG